MINKIKVGEKDKWGNVVKAIWADNPSPEYTIYESTDEIMQIDYESKLYKLVQPIGSLNIRIKNLSRNNRTLINIYKEAQFESWKLSINNNEKDAKNVLIEAEKRIINIKKISSKLNYLLGAVIVMVISVIILLLLSIIPMINENTVILASVFTCGSFGSFLSVAINLNKLNLDIDSSSISNMILGSSRGLIGIISSIFIYLLIKAGFIFNVFTGSATIYTFLSLSIIAGFSETFIPNIIQGVETKEVNKITEEEVASNKKSKRKNKNKL